MLNEKKSKIIYWIATVWLALGMTSTGVVQLIRMEEEVERTVEYMGYPTYFLTIIGTWKLLGVVAILIPKFPIIKEWAYAGFFFNMTGALISHMVMSDPITEYFPATLLLVLIIVSYLFRPVSRKPSVHQINPNHA